MRLNADVITIGCDCRRRADVDAEVASWLAGATVSTDRCLVVEELRLFELADRQRNFGNRRGLRERIGARTPVTLWRLMQREARLPAEIEHEVEALLAPGVASLEINGSDG